jgi:hypothetical protein
MGGGIGAISIQHIGAEFHYIRLAINGLNKSNTANSLKSSKKGFEKLQYGLQSRFTKVERLFCYILYSNGTTADSILESGDVDARNFIRLSVDLSQRDIYAML